jgi:hypothetical protein
MPQILINVVNARHEAIAAVPAVADTTLKGHRYLSITPGALDHLLGSEATAAALKRVHGYCNWVQMSDREFRAYEGFFREHR